MVKIPIEIINSIKKLKENIKSELSVKKVILFGSYVNGNYSENSDIDVCIIAENVPNNYLAMLKIAPKVVEINPKIESVVFSDKEYKEKKLFGLLKEIKRKGIEI